MYIYSHFICLTAKKLDKIQVYTEVYEYVIKNVLYKICSYQKHMAEKSFERRYSAAE